MSAKLRVLLFALVLVAAMIGEGESFFGTGGVGQGNGKRSMLNEVWNEAQRILSKTKNMQVEAFHNLRCIE